MGANSNNKTSENRPILLLFGEGDFSFSKTLIELNNYQDYDIIATEFREENDLKGYPNFQDNIRIVRTSPNFKILFGVDIETCDWENIYKRIYGESETEIPKIDIIQFNFPYYFRDNTTVGFKKTAPLVDKFFEFGRNKLKSNGELKLALSTNHLAEYEIEDYTKINGFSYIGNENFHDTFPGYKHVSSMPGIIMPEIRSSGILITYKLKSNINLA